MKEHGAYWRDLSDKGFVIVFGPVLDPKGVWGVGIVEVQDEVTAWCLADNDPVIKAGPGFNWKIFLMAGAVVRK